MDIFEHTVIVDKHSHVEKWSGNIWNCYQLNSKISDVSSTTVDCVLSSMIGDTLSSTVGDSIHLLTITFLPQTKRLLERYLSGARTSTISPTEKTPTVPAAIARSYRDQYLLIVLSLIVQRLCSRFATSGIRIRIKETVIGIVWSHSNYGVCRVVIWCYSSIDNTRPSSGVLWGSTWCDFWVWLSLSTAPCTRVPSFFQCQTWYKQPDIFGHEFSAIITSQKSDEIVVINEVVNLDQADRQKHFL